MAPADGQKTNPPASGDLIIASDGTPLIVLGLPDTTGEDERFGRLLDGVIVVLTPDGTPSLHLVSMPPGRKPFLSPWDSGWIPLPCNPAPHMV